MRILVVTPFYRPAYVYGGPARSIPALCEGIAALGHGVTVFTTNANGSDGLVLPVGTQNVRGVETWYFPRLGKGNFFYAPELGLACSRNLRTFDLMYVFSNWCYPLLPACRAAAAAHVPYVVTPRTSFMAEAWRRKQPKKLAYHLMFERRWINSAAALHYTTELELLQSNWLRLKPPVHVVPNPIDVDDFKQLPARGRFRQRLGIPERAFIILYLGRLEPRKGADITLAAFARIRAQAADARLVIAGPDRDGYEKKLRRSAGALGIANRVHFAGSIDSMARLEAFADADLFMLTSRCENFGVSAVEAMAAGVPVLVSDQVGIADEVRCSRAGIVVSLDIGEIASQLAMLVSCSQLRASFGPQAAAVARKYSPARVAGEMMHRLQKIRERGHSTSELTPSPAAGCRKVQFGG